MAKKILIIDDSALMRRVISDIIKACNDYEVAGIAKDGVEGLDMIVSNPDRYDAIIMDINMPRMNGLELLEQIQRLHLEQTVIVVSTVAKQGAKETIRALELGAFDFVTKPENYLETKGDTFREQIERILDVATLHKQSRRLPRTGKDTLSHGTSSTFAGNVQHKPALQTHVTEPVSKIASHTPEADGKRVSASQYVGVKKGKNKIIALACSTGGPKSLQQVIPLLPEGLDAPMVLVQHMPAGFTLSLAQRLDEMSAVHVKEAEDGEFIQKGTVYIAPGGRHMRIMRNTRGCMISLSDEPAIDGLRPCANIMYESLESCGYDEITCVVLTGMGADGTNGIKSLNSRHVKIHVIAQDESTCVVYGMPKAIAQSGLVNTVVPLSQVAEEITKNVGVS